MISSSLSLLSFFFFFSPWGSAETTPFPYNEANWEDSLWKGSLRNFPTYSEVLTLIDHFEKWYPLYKEVIGHTYENYPIFLYSIGKCKGENGQNNPTSEEILITGLHHAREPLSMTVTLYLLGRLLKKRQENVQIEYLLENNCIKFIPALNIDGYRYIETSADYMVRKNRRPTCQDNPRSSGVDLNRNYDAQWSPTDEDFRLVSPCHKEDFPGEFAFSEPETRAIKNLLEASNFTLALNFHAYGEFWTHPFNYVRNVDANLPPPLHQIYEDIKNNIRVKSFSNAYALIKYNTFGESDDYMLGTHGIISMSPEVGKEEHGFWPPVHEIKDTNAREFDRSVSVFLMAGMQITVSIKKITEQNWTLNVRNRGIQKKKIDKNHKMVFFLMPKKFAQDQNFKPLKKYSTNHNVNYFDPSPSRQIFTPLSSPSPLPLSFPPSSPLRLYTTTSPKAQEETPSATDEETGEKGRGKRREISLLSSPVKDLPVKMLYHSFPPLFGGDTASYDILLDEDPADPLVMLLCFVKETELRYCHCQNRYFDETEMGDGDEMDFSLEVTANTTSEICERSLATNAAKVVNKAEEQIANIADVNANGASQDANPTNTNANDVNRVAITANVNKNDSTKSNPSTPSSNANSAIKSTVDVSADRPSSPAANVKASGANALGPDSAAKDMTDSVMTASWVSDKDRRDREERRRKEEGGEKFSESWKFDALCLGAIGGGVLIFLMVQYYDVSDEFLKSEKEREKRGDLGEERRGEMGGVERDKTGDAVKSVKDFLTSLSCMFTSFFYLFVKKKKKDVVSHQENEIRIKNLKKERKKKKKPSADYHAVDRSLI